MATIGGTSGNDNLNGTSGNDTLNGLGGNDTLIASGGTDFYDGGAGIDTLDLRLTAAGVVVSFSAGTISGGFNGTFVNMERVLGSNGADSIIGAAGNQNLSGRGGNDTLAGGVGNDTLWGGGGDADRFVFRETGTANADSIADFTSGADKIVLDAAVMTALGASGNFASGDARFVANSNGTAQDSSDRVIFNTTTRQVLYDADGNGSGAAQVIATLQSGATLAATDIVVEGGSTAGPQPINGTAGADSLVGTPGNDTINGFAGNDTIDGRAGADSMVGGSGDDTYFVDSPGDVVVEAADGGFDTVNASVTYTLPAFVNHLTLMGAMAIEGTGNDANNVLIGNGAENTLSGRLGVDTLTGGAGEDRFLFDTAPAAGNADTITDFSLEEDRIVLDARVMTALGANGNFAAGDARFAANSTGTAQDSSDRVIFNTTTGQLFYDADGNGSGAAVLIATLQNPGRLVDGDIIVVNGTPPVGETINGTPGNDTLAGGPGDDTLDGLGGHDQLFGNEGNDSVIGGDGADFLDGGGGDDVLRGGSFMDTLVGGEGNDTFDGDFDGALIHTGAGSDRVLFTQTPREFNLLTVQDFSSGTDRLVLDVQEMRELGTTGDFVAGDERFHAAAGATSGHDASDRLIYNTSNGWLLYDPDGSGSLAAEHIATFTVGTPLAATDFAVFDSRAGVHVVGTNGNDSLVGSTGDDTIEGLAGNDTLDGFGGRDILDGGLGNDTYLSDWVLRDAGGIDIVIAPSFGVMAPGIENLTLRGFWDPNFDNLAIGNELDNVIINEEAIWAMLDGGEGNDTLIGGPAPDTFFFSGGSDVVDGRGGRDGLDLQGTESAVLIDFAAGRVTVGAVAGSGTMSFTNIEDAIGGSHDDRLVANDSGGVGLYGYLGNDTLTGGAGDDFLHGDGIWADHDLIGGGNDQVFGGAGNDRLIAGEGSDLLDGGAGNDVLGLSSDFGAQVNDTVLFTVAPGAANADQISGFISAEDQIVLDGTVHANSGSSGTFAAGDARFWSSTSGTAHDADDRVIYNTITGELRYDADGSGSSAAQLIATLEGAPTLAAIDIAIVNGSAASGQVINGTSGNDTLSGTAGNDTINGLEGIDLFLAGSTGGNDVIDGGAGRDSIEFVQRATSAVTVDFVAGTITGGSSGTISFTNIERIVAGNFNDVLNGNAAAQNLTGQGGSDTIWGAGGADTLWGAGGADVFVFREMGAANADRISDFTSGADRLQLDDSAFTAIGALGSFTATDARFAAGAGFTSGRDANDRVVFDTTTGSLYYDADGSGAGAAQLIATVQAGATVAAGDIVVI